MDDETRRELQSLRLAVEGLTQVVLRMEAKGKGGLAGAEIPELTKLTPRQHAVLQGMVYGMKLEDIATIMGGISTETVKTHQRQIGKKFNVTRQSELRVMCQRFLDAAEDADYLAATGGFSKDYMLKTEVGGTDELRHLIAPVKPGLMVNGN